MVNIEKWICRYVEAVKKQFGERICFVGLQGSYGRGEAIADSDIDLVLILDFITIAELDAYSKLLDRLPSREKICGFISGWAEIEAWDKSDLFQFCHDTRPIIGSLDGILQSVTEDDIKRAIKIGACNLYHACAHNFVYEKSTDILRELYKSAAFTLQAIGFLQRGVFERRQENLLSKLEAEDRHIMEIRLLLKRQEQITQEEFKRYSDALVSWTSGWIRKTEVI